MVAALLLSMNNTPQPAAVHATRSSTAQCVCLFEACCSFPSEEMGSSGANPLVCFDALEAYCTMPIRKLNQQIIKLYETMYWMQNVQN